MAYLHSCKIVHRDLAARNLLASFADGQYVVKVSDFGLSKQLDGDIYEMNAQGKVFPIKWTALEVIEHRVYTFASDVWSFGVAMWEILSNGGTPYAAMTNMEAVQYIAEGNRLKKPVGCSDEVYAVMLDCWNAKVEARPTFEQLTTVIKKLQQ